MKELATLCTPFDGYAKSYADKLCGRVYKSLIDSVSASGDQENIDWNATSELWAPEAGVLATALRKARVNGSDKTLNAQLAILKAISGCKVNFDETIDAMFPLRAEGTDYPLGSLRIEIDKGRICIRANGVSSNSYRILEFDGHRVRILRDTQWMKYWLDANAADSSGADHSAFEQMFISVKEALAKFAPEYMEWTSLLLKEITPFPCAGLGSNSSSFITFPGHVHMSIPCSISAGAVTLVHECSHQFFHLIEWNMSIVANRKCEVYSILKMRNRPLSRVLLGYHAFVNALTVLSLMGDRGFVSEDFDRVYDHTRQLVSGLAETLTKVSEENFTPAGFAIYERLRDVDQLVRSRH